MENIVPLQPMLSVADVAAYLNVTRQAVYAAINGGDLVAYRIGAGFRIKPADLDAYLEVLRSRCSPAQAAPADADAVG